MRKLPVLSSLTATILTVVAAGVIMLLTFRSSGDSCITFRAEGLTLREAIPSAIAYATKYFRQSWCTDDTIISRFSGRTLPGGQPDSRSPESGSVATIAFAGDIMWIRNRWDAFLDDRLRTRLSQFDMVFANLETPVDTLSPVPSLLPDYVRYNSAPGLVRSFRRPDGSSIFTILSLANNHADDRGASGLERTVAFLHDENIGTSGINFPYEKETAYTVTEIRGIKIGFYSAGWGLNEPSRLLSGEFLMNTINGIAPAGTGSPDASQVLSALNRMEEDSVNLRVLYLHWGYEFEMYPDPAIIRLAHELAGAGADLIIGSHPHVIQPIEIWEEKLPGADSLRKPRRTLIAYSLGNFTTAMYAPEHRLGMVLPVRITLMEPGERAGWQIDKPLFVYNYPSGLAGHNRRLLIYNDLLEELSEESPAKAFRLSKRLERVFRLGGHTFWQYHPAPVPIWNKPRTGCR